MRGGLLRGDDQQRLRPGGHAAHRAVEPGAKIEDHPVIARSRAAQPGEHRFHRGGVERGEGAGTGTPGQHVEPAGLAGQHRLVERGAPARHGGEIDLRGQPELDVHIGEAEVTVEEQHALAAPGERMGEGDGEPGLAHASLAGGDRDDAAGAGAERRLAGARRRASCGTSGGRVGTGEALGEEGGGERDQPVRRARPDARLGQRETAGAGCGEHGAEPAGEVEPGRDEQRGARLGEGGGELGGLIRDAGRRAARARPSRSPCWRRRRARRAARGRTGRCRARRSAPARRPGDGRGRGRA